MQPVVLDELLDKSKYQELLQNLPSIDSGMIDSGRSRHMAENDFIKRMGISLEAVAKKVFGSDSLQSSYSLYCRYYGDASMEMHKDDNACTYTIDLCVRQTEPWPIYVEGNQYLLKENQALCYLGNDQLHGRQPKNLGPNGSVEMVFFHFVEPDHWFFAGR